MESYERARRGRTLFLDHRVHFSKETLNELYIFLRKGRWAPRKKNFRARE